MDIKFTKIKFQNRFDSSFESFEKNNVITFSELGFINIYAPNGVGKSSLAKTLNNNINAEYEYEYKSMRFDEKSETNPIMVIEDFFLRNIATRVNEQLSDYILGSKIKEELELEKQLNDVVVNFRNDMISYIKNEYNIKTKKSNLCTYFSNYNLVNFIKSLANSHDQGKEYNVEKILKLSNSLELNEEKDYDDMKYKYVKLNIEGKNSIINSILNFNVNNLKKIKGLKKLELNNEAIEILNKHKEIKTCIFEECHTLSDDVKEKLEENRDSIMNQLNEEEKVVVNDILQIENNPFNMKELFNTCFEIGNFEAIINLQKEIKLLISQIENEIIKTIYEKLKNMKIHELYDKICAIRNEKLILTEDDAVLLKNIIENCINKSVQLERDNNQNIIFKIGNSEIIGKERQELPLSTGEQNFISLYFDLLAAKNSEKNIIIIDDPISSFDSIYKNKIMYAIIKILAQKKKVIILTHNIETIKLMQYQCKNCFNLYLLKNEPNGENGFIKINKRRSNRDELEDMELMLEIKNIIDLFRNENFYSRIKNKKQFLISVMPFIRSYCNILSDKHEIYKEICKAMHGYENGRIDINKIFFDIFGVKVLNCDYEVDIDEILKIEIDNEIIDESKYPLLNRTMVHNFNYLQLRILVEKTLYNYAPNKVNWNRNPSLHLIIENCLKENLILKNILISKKTLLNEFNHFDYDMCLFMPSLDISDNKLKEEKKSIENVCTEINRMPKKYKNKYRI